MLIEFSISNYRSFREKQTFSMVAAPRLRKGDNVFKPVVKGEKLPDLLKVAAIYGPNASGKSNLIKAFDIVKDIANRQPSATFTPFPVTPFRFDPELANQPTRIELHFVYAEQRYQFDLALTQERIVEERLIAFPKGKETLLYERQHTASGDEYTFGAKLEAERDLYELWRKLTGSQTLFIAQAVANSSETLTQLSTPFQWIQNGFFNLHRDMRRWASSSKNLVKGGHSFSEKISTFLQEIDVPISDMRVENEKLILTHQTTLGTADFDLEDESEGTQNLIGFWFPWTIHIDRSNFSEGDGTLIVDELDSSLHPEIVISLVRKHIVDEEPKQLIFTTHDTHLMDAKILRRDQFWLTERDANGATQLRSIHDFEGRESEDLEKRYYEGRYRGLPIIRRG
jgi:predicted ATP-dependent endonuclease of OLD family